MNFLIDKQQTEISVVDIQARQYAAEAEKQAEEMLAKDSDEPPAAEKAEEVSVVVVNSESRSVKPRDKLKEDICLIESVIFDTVTLRVLKTCTKIVLFDAVIAEGFQRMFISINIIVSFNQQDIQGDCINCYKNIC